MSKKLSSDIVQIAKTGVNLIIDADGRMMADITNIVAAAAAAGGHVTIRDANSKMVADLVTLASKYPKNVTIDLS